LETPGKGIGKIRYQGKRSQLFILKALKAHGSAVVTNAHVPNHAVLLLKQMDILLYNQPRKQTSDHVEYMYMKLVGEACPFP